MNNIYNISHAHLLYIICFFSSHAETSFCLYIPLLSNLNLLASKVWISASDPDLDPLDPQDFGFLDPDPNPHQN